MALTICCICGSAAADAQSSREVQQCVQVRTDPDRAIRRCTSIIESGTFSGTNLAVAYNNRGLAWTTKGDFDRAISDFDMALRLNPRAANTLTNRGLVWIHRGDYERAVVDFDAALNLDARDTTALRNRGLARFFQRQFDLASQDFARRQRLTKAPDPYDVIWRYLAQARNEEVAGPTLAEHARQHADPAWPGPLIQLFLGGIGPQALDAATRDADAQVQVEQLCEANYYAGQWHLLRNEPAQAISRFRAAESGCPKLFLEYSGAVAELKRSR